MGTSRTLIVSNRIEEIRTIEKFLDEFSEPHDFPPSALFHLHLALEEIFTNIVSYGYDDDTEHEIEIILSKNGQTVTVEIADDGRPFDPLQDAPEMDTKSTLKERRIGGMGIALTKTTMTDLRYRRDEGRNHLTMIKDL